MPKYLSLFALSLVLVGAGCASPSEPMTDGMPPAPEPGMEDQVMEKNDDDMLIPSEELEFVDDIGHNDSAEVLELACENDLEFTWESLSTGEYTLTLENGSSGFLPAAGEVISLTEAVSGSGARYETDDALIVVTEQAGEFTILSEDRVAAEGCVVL